MGISNWRKWAHMGTDSAEAARGLKRASLLLVKLNVATRFLCVFFIKRERVNNGVVGVFWV